MTTLEAHALLLRKTAARVQCGRSRAYRAWRRVAASRRRAFCTAAILGGADYLGERIRALLRDGTLKAIDGRTWAGDGSGVNRCACCGELIRATDKEFEPEACAGTFAHSDCLTIWRAESVALNGQERAGG